MDVRQKYVMQKVNRKEKSICPNCIHHNICIAENNQPCFECNRFMDAHGVTAQEWIPVDDRLPEENHDGFADAVLVTDGFVQHMAYFVGGEWRFAESGEIKEPMWYRITHWMPLPQPPKGE